MNHVAADWSTLHLTATKEGVLPTARGTWERNPAWLCLDCFLMMSKQGTGSAMPGLTQDHVVVSSWFVVIY